MTRYKFEPGEKIVLWIGAEGAAKRESVYLGTIEKRGSKKHLFLAYNYPSKEPSLYLSDEYCGVGCVPAYPCDWEDIPDIGPRLAQVTLEFDEQLEEKNNDFDKTCKVLVGLKKNMANEVSTLETALGG